VKIIKSEEAKKGYLKKAT